MKLLCDSFRGLLKLVVLLDYVELLLEQIHFVLQILKLGLNIIICIRLVAMQTVLIQLLILLADQLELLLELALVILYGLFRQLLVDLYVVELYFHFIQFQVIGNSCQIICN